MGPEDAIAHPADAAEEPDLISLLREKAMAASHRSLLGTALTSGVGIVLTALFTGGRYYLTLPLLAAACFATYGLAAHRRARVTGDADADYARQSDARVIMKAAELIGVASAVAAMLTFFILVLGPSWTL